jgi:hypothetical protein
MAYINGYTLDCTTYPRRRRPAHVDCTSSGICVCGHCKGAGQCDLADCPDNATRPCERCGRRMCGECLASGTHKLFCRARG